MDRYGRRTLAGRVAGAAAGGFTLIELIVVIAIIAILAGLALFVGQKVAQGGRESLTKDLIRVLNGTVASYQADRDAKAPWKYTDLSPAKNEFAIIDARANPAPADVDQTNNPAEPSVALYLLATGEAPSVKSALGGIDSRFIRRGTFAVTTGTTNIVIKQASGSSQLPTEPGNGGSPGNTMQGLEILDAWGNPIRYVHPKFQGGAGNYFNDTTSNIVTRDTMKVRLSRSGGASDYEFRRSYRPFNPSTPPAGTKPIGDADEGLCTGGAPYFYSPGPDKDPGTREDNVYENKPQFQAETGKFL